MEEEDEEEIMRMFYNEYIIADSSILNDIIKEISIILPSLLWWSRVLQVGENINNNEVK